MTYFLLLLPCSPASILTLATIQTRAQRCALYSPLFHLQDVTTMVGGRVDWASMGSLFAPCMCSPLSIYSLRPLCINTTLTNGSVICPLFPCFSLFSWCQLFQETGTKKKMDIGPWTDHEDKSDRPFFLLQCVMSSFFESAIPPFPPSKEHRIVSLDYSCPFHTAKRKRVLLWEM